MAAARRAAASCKRTAQQFHWSNAGYGTFDDFLASLASRKRKAMRKERAEALAAGLDDRDGCGAATSRRRTGTPSSPSTWTPARASGGGPTSTARSSRCSAQAMADRCLLILAKRGKRPIAGSLHMIGGDCLYRPLLGRDRASPLPALRALLLPGHRVRHRSTSSRAWRPARRASTSWRAAICRPRPTRRTTSPTRRCAARSPISSSASAPTWMRRARSSPSTRPSARRRLRRSGLTRWPRGR